MAQYQILDVASMAKYKPNQYTKNATGQVLLNQGVAPIAGTYKPYAAPTTNQGTFVNPTTNDRKAFALGAQPTGYQLEQKIASPTQLPNYQVTNKTATTLYGIPKTAVPKTLTSQDLAGGATEQLPQAKEQNTILAQAQLQNTQIEDQARQSAYSQQLQSLADQVKATMPTETFTAEQSAQNKTDLLAKQAEIRNLNLKTDQAISAQDFNPNLLTSQVGKSQAQIAREASFQSRALTDQEAGLLNSINLSNQEKQQIIEGTKTIADYQSNIQNYIDNEKQSILQQSQVLTENQKNSFATTLQLLQGVNPDKMTAQQSAQLAELAQSAGISPQLVMAGLKTLYSQQSLDNSLKQQELNASIANTKFNQNLATQNLQLDRSKFSSDQSYREAQLALDYAQLDAAGNPANKPMTEAQRKANGYATRMSEAHDIIANYEQLGSQLIGAATQYAPNVFKSADRQAMEQAQRNFINAVLRQESGAAIAPTEFDSAKLQYFPQPGDSQKVIDQKRANRQTAINGMLGESGTVNTPTTGIADDNFGW